MLELGCEVSQGGWFIGDPVAGEGACPLFEFEDDLDDIVDVGLGVGSAWDGEADEFHVGVLTHHDRANLTTSDAPGFVECDGEGLSRELVFGDVGAESRGIDIDRVTACWADGLDAGFMEFLAEVFGRADAVAEVVLAEDLVESDGHRFEITPGESAVGHESLGKDEQIACRVCEFLIAEEEDTPDVDHAVLFGTDCRTVAEVKLLASDVGDGAVLLAGFALFDEPRVLGKAAGIKDEWFVVFVTDRADGLHVFEGDRLSADGVAGDGDHDEGDIIGSVLKEFFEGDEVHVAFERGVGVWILAFGGEEVDGGAAGMFDVGAGGVEVGVVGDDLAFASIAVPDHNFDEEAFGCSALVCGEDVDDACDFFDDITEAEPARCPGVGLIAPHDPGPLFGAHGSGARVGQEIDHDIL